MNIATNLYQNSGIAGIVSWASGNPAKTTISVQNLAVNSGIQIAQQPLAQKDILAGVRDVLQKILIAYQALPHYLASVEQSPTVKTIAMSESIVSKQKTVLPPVKKTRNS